jgi:hypothetical protein
MGKSSEIKASLMSESEKKEGKSRSETRRHQFYHGDDTAHHPVAGFAPQIDS